MCIDAGAGVCEKEKAQGNYSFHHHNNQKDYCFPLHKLNDKHPVSFKIFEFKWFCSFLIHEKKYLNRKRHMAVFVKRQFVQYCRLIIGSLNSLNNKVIG